MPKSRKHREYRFEIDAFSPTSMPMARLTEYLADLAKVFGNNNSVHLLKMPTVSRSCLRIWTANPSE